jgi:hypothetical protein
MLIIVLVIICHWLISWVRWVQPTISNPIFTTILLLSSHLWLSLPSVLLHSHLPTKILCTLLISSMSAKSTWPAHLTPLKEQINGRKRNVRRAYFIRVCEILWRFEATNYMDKALKSSNSECYTPSSEPFEI